jgi:LPS O-antigen subunit length determinant protein (WzzB/FepE family)
MNPERSQEYDEVIKLSDIIEFIWNGKWIISGITLVISLVMVIYLMVVSPNYKGVLEIFPISTIEATKYEELSISYKELMNSSDKIFDSKKFDSKELELLFIQNLLRYKGFEASIIENGYLKKIENETEFDYLMRVKKAARNFSLSKPEQKNSNDLLKKKGKFTLSITTHQPDLVLKVISDGLAHTNNIVKRQIASSIDRTLASYSRRNARKLEDIEVAQEILRKDQKMKTRARLAFLNEQKAIAIALNIDKNALITRTFTEGSTLINSVSNAEPFYLRGHLAIEEEIKLLSSRKSPELFITEVLINETVREKIIQDRSVPRVKEIVSLTPIGTDKFKSIFYDVNSIKLERTPKPLMLLALSILLGGIIGLCVLTIRNVVSEKK